MVRCTNCNELIRFDSKKCFACGHIFTKNEIQGFIEEEKVHEEKLNLHRKLTMRADNLEYLGTLCVIVAILLIFPIFTNFFNYAKLSGSIDSYTNVLADQKAQLSEMTKGTDDYALMEKYISRNEDLISDTEDYCATCARKAVLYSASFVAACGISIFSYYYRKSCIKKRNTLL
jgi:hypothetical protein